MAPVATARGLAAATTGAEAATGSAAACAGEVPSPWYPPGALARTGLGTGETAGTLALTEGTVLDNDLERSVLPAKEPATNDGRPDFGVAAPGIDAGMTDATVVELAAGTVPDTTCPAGAAATADPAETDAVAAATAWGVDETTGVVRADIKSCLVIRWRFCGSIMSRALSTSGSVISIGLMSFKHFRSSLREILPSPRMSKFWKHFAGVKPCFSMF